MKGLRSSTIRLIGYTILHCKASYRASQWSQSNKHSFRPQAARHQVGDLSDWITRNTMICILTLWIFESPHPTNKLYSLCMYSLIYIEWMNKTKLNFSWLNNSCWFCKALCPFVVISRREVSLNGHSVILNLTARGILK